MKHRILFISVLSAFLLLIDSEISAQWVQARAPFKSNCQITCFAEIGKDLFAGTSVDGLFLTKDDGASWTLVNTPWPAYLSINALCVLDTSLFVSLFAGGVFRTSDNGATWISADSVINSFYVNTFAVSGSNIYLGTGNGSSEGGVYRSSDGGITWSPMNSGLPSDYIDALFAAGTNIFASVAGEIYLMVDGSSTWNRTDSIPKIWIHTFARIGTNIFAATGNGIYTTIDNGKKWLHVQDNLPSNTSIYFLAANGTDLFGISDSAIFLSTDQGITWASIDNGLPPNGSYGSFIISGQHLFSGTNNNGIFRSVNKGKSWDDVSYGLAENISITAVFTEGKNIFLGTGGGVYLSTDTGTTWKAMDSNSYSPYPLGYISSFVLNGSTLFAARGNIFKSDNGGKYWVKADSGVVGSVNDLAISNGNLFATTGDSFSQNGDIFRSTNNGASWTSLHTVYLPPWPAYTKIAANGKNIFFATDYSYGSGYYGIFYSSDNGDNWSQLNTGLMNSHLVTALAISGMNIFAGTDTGIFVSSDNGVNWTSLNNGLPSNSHIVSFATMGKNVFVAADSGIYFLADGSNQWILAGGGITGILRTDLENIFVGSRNVLWHRPLSDFGISSVLRKIIDVNSVTTFPNPFVQSATITFSTQDRGIAEISIINLLGVEVARLYSGVLDAGEYSFLWDASTMLPGTYLCVVRTRSGMSSIPLILLDRK